MCDIAFSVPIFSRSNSEELLEKIHCNAKFICAYRESPLGYAALYANDLKDRTAYLTLIAVKPEFQKSHVGYGLLCACFSIAKSYGMKKLKLEVLHDNQNAIGFYQHFGLQIIGDATENSYYMEKIL